MQTEPNDISNQSTPDISENTQNTLQHGLHAPEPALLESERNQNDATSSESSLGVVGNVEVISGVWRLNSSDHHLSTETSGSRIVDYENTTTSPSPRLESAEPSFEISKRHGDTLFGPQLDHFPNGKNRPNQIDQH